jgi:hypothetical protein
MTRQVKQPRQRVLISNQYEKKIDGIEDRLAGIEKILQSLSSRLAASQRIPFKSNTHSPSNGEATAHPGVTESPAAYEGNTTTHAHSVFAREVLERAVGSSPMTGQNPEMNAALTSLQGIVSRLSVQASTHESVVSEYPFSQDASISSVKDLRLPTQEYVKYLIQQTFEEESESVTFTKFFPFLDKQQFIDMCDDVFRQDGNCSQTRLLIFYGGLYWLFYEYSTMQRNHPMVTSFEQYAVLCRHNLEVMLSGLNLLMPATLENIQALLLAVSIVLSNLRVNLTFLSQSAYSVEVSKPNMCWMLNSTAASFCQALGYHRRESMKNDTESEKQVKTSIFW